jgi:hypothetical protein
MLLPFRPCRASTATSCRTPPGRGRCKHREGTGTPRCSHWFPPRRPSARRQVSIPVRRLGWSGLTTARWRLRECWPGSPRRPRPQPPRAGTADRTAELGETLHGRRPGHPLGCHLDHRCTRRSVHRRRYHLYSVTARPATVGRRRPGPSRIVAGRRDRTPRRAAWACPGCRRLGRHRRRPRVRRTAVVPRVATDIRLRRRRACSARRRVRRRRVRRR